MLLVLTSSWSRLLDCWNEEIQVFVTLVLACLFVASTLRIDIISLVDLLYFIKVPSCLRHLLVYVLDRDVSLNCWIITALSCWSHLRMTLSPICLRSHIWHIRILGSCLRNVISLNNRRVLLIWVICVSNAYIVSSFVSWSIRICQNVPIVLWRRVLPSWVAMRNIGLISIRSCRNWWYWSISI